MKRHGRCRLLELPREVRDYIYDELTQDACISTGVADKLGNVINIPLYIVLLGAPRTNVLLTNRQIHDEYDEHLANQGRLYVSYEHGASDTGTDWNFTARSLGLKPSVSCDALKHIRLCSIEFDWQMAIHSLDWPTASQSLSDDGPAMNEFFLLPIAQMRAQTALPWTPSKGLRTPPLSLRMTKTHADITNSPVWTPEASPRVTRTPSFGRCQSPARDESHQLSGCTRPILDAWLRRRSGPGTYHKANRTARECIRPRDHVKLDDRRGYHVAKTWSFECRVLHDHATVLYARYQHQRRASEP